MQASILKELKRLEETRDIKILLAVESGSRAWGVASTDSDWDVRFIYIHRPEWYLTIDSPKDTIEVMLPGDLDFAGWELRKTLQLFRKSNPPLLEWLRSPSIYLEQFTTAQQLRAMVSTYFNPRSVTYHYLHMAKGIFKDHLQKEAVRLKRYFYVLRPMLACRWIERTGEMPPVEFQVLLEAEKMDGAVRREIDVLLAKKISGEELDAQPPIQLLNTYLSAEIKHFETQFSVKGSREKASTEALNELLRGTLKEVWG